MKIEISESADGARLKIVFGSTFVVELDSLDASTFGQKLADRARYAASLDSRDSRRTATTEIGSDMVDDGRNPTGAVSGGGGEAVGDADGAVAREVEGERRGAG